MNVHDIAAYVGRFLQGALTAAREYWLLLRNGDFWKRKRVWWRANWFFAVIALALASFLYFRIFTELQHSGTRIIPVMVEVLGEGKTTFADVDPREIKVEVSGSESDVRKFETSTQPIRLSVSTEKLAQSSERGVPITIKGRRDIPGLRELGLRFKITSGENTVYAKYDVPGDVEFSIEKPKIEGTPKRGEVVDVRYTPERVLLRGGQNWLRSLKDKEVLTIEPVNVEEFQVGSVDITRKILLPESLQKTATLSVPTNVTVSLEIVPNVKTRSIDNIAVRLSAPVGLSLPKGYRVKPLSVTATLTGYNKSMDSLSNTTLTAYAVIPSIAALDLKYGATNTLSVKLDIPSDKEIWTVETDPSSVELIMPPVPRVEVPPSRVAVTNAPAHTAVTNAPTHTAVTNAPAHTAVTNAPVRIAVTNAPVRIAVTNAPAHTAVTNAPARIAVTNAPALATPTNSIPKDTVKNGNPKEH